MTRTTRCIELTVVALLLAACSSRSTPEAEYRETETVIVAERMPASPGPISDFVADVPAVEEGGECEKRAIPGVGSQVGLAFPNRSTPARRVWITYADGGTITYYSDERGDLVQKVVGPDGGPPQPGEVIRALPPVGRQTAIHINFENQVGMAINIGGDKPALAFNGTPAEMMDAANLGNPAGMIDLTVRRCGR